MCLICLYQSQGKYVFPAGELRQSLAVCEDPEEIWRIRRRIAVLSPILTEMNELSELTARYYERGYWRSEKYTL